MKFKLEISAGGIVFRRHLSSGTIKTEWLVVQHSGHKGWVFPKGLVGDKKKGEQMEEAALREVEEEGGVKAKIVYDTPVKVEYRYRFEDFLVKKIVYYFLMEYVSGDPANHDWEVLQAKFLPKAEVKKILTYPSDRDAFEKILKVFREFLTNQ
ncbi:MAG: NUDIX domain-containing protein [Candidatus Woesearchaeota archaeon]